MPIIIKGDLVTKPVEEKPTPQPLNLRWNDIINRPVPNEQPKSEPVKPIIKRQVVEKEIVETPSHYHEETHGELQKLFNKKSDYLRDILDFDSNK
jgi:hypothetical protein